MYMKTHMFMHMCTFRDLESGLSKTIVSGLEKQSQERPWWSSDTDVQIVRYNCVLGRKTNRTIPQCPAGVEQLHQVKRMIGGIGNLFLSTYSQT